MNRAKLMAYIGFAQRAGKCRSGDATCEKLVKGGKARLVMVDAGASASTAQRYADMCARAGIACLSIEGLGRQIGKEAIMIAAITDAHFAQIIREAYGSAEQA